MTRVWSSSKASEGQLLVLLAIADCADDDGNAWPKLETLGLKSRLSVRQTQRCLQQLEKLGELKVEKRQRPDGGSSASLYQVLIPRPPGDIITPPGVTKCQGEGDIHVTRGVTFGASSPSSPSLPHTPSLPLTPPSLEPSIEPSVREEHSILAKGSNGHRSADDWLEKLRAIYVWVNFDQEIGKAKAHLLKPRCKGRKFTQTYFTNWLNRIDKPLETRTKKWNPEPSWREYHMHDDDDAYTK